ncbi:hypothetical protein BDZ45DRAFT_361920 [Acephala macrosclerotiorum]|nr:hypothetical protein BDZ45DRAFT_361920 [Acephala macrosclerotiorum]
MDIADEKSLLRHDSSATIFDTWKDYLRGDSLFTNNVERVSRRLQEEKKKLFSKEEKMEVDILNVLNCRDGHGLQTRRRKVHDCSSLDDYLSEMDDFHTRFISIAAPNSIRPLKITESGLYSILSRHNVGPQFLDLLLSFATGRNESEAGPRNTIVKNHPDGSYEIQYRVSYVEETVGHGGKEWAIRQMGVYHRHVPGRSGNIWILLHPKPGSTAQTRLENCAVEWDERKGSFDDWELTHILVLSSYFDDWRWYLKSLSAEAGRIASIALSYDFSTAQNHERGTDILQELHSLLNKIMPISPRLRSTLGTISSLRTLYGTLRRENLYTEHHSVQILDELKTYEIHTEGHLASVALLEKKVQETVSLLAVALNLKNQSTTLSINHNILSLTKDTVDDSVTVRVVGIVTLIYLPATFVTSLLGMNLFSFQTSQGSGFQISKQFWIFFLITIPLTVITVGSWLVAIKRKDKKKNRDRRIQALGYGQSVEM